MMSSGTLAGFPVVDVTATLYDGSFHDVDSSVLAFQIAARAAFREGMRKGAVRLLEPIMKVGHSSHHTCCLAACWCTTSKCVHQHCTRDLLIHIWFPQPGAMQSAYEQQEPIALT